MAHFYGNLQGNRGEATRMGSKDSGISGHIRGWDSGVRVTGFVDSEGRDCFEVWATGGSSGSAQSKRIGRVVLTDDGILVLA